MRHDRRRTEPSRDAPSVGITAESATPAPSPTLVDRIVSHAASHGDSVALVEGTVSWTYAELVGRVEHVAALLGELEVAGRPVVVFAQRGRLATAGMLGAMAAGAVSIPVDTGATATWLEEIADDASPAAVLTDAAHAGVVAALGVPTIRLDEAAPLPDPAPLPVIDPADAAYVIYTSGSTGRPKGVVVEHAQLSAYIDNFAGLYGIGPSSRTVQFHALSFDASVEDLFLPLARGGSVLHLDADRLSTIDRFLAWCGEHRVTHLSLPTAFFHEVVIGLSEGASWPGSVSTVMFGGEAARPDAIRSWTDVMGSRVRLLNVYGPTEVTVVCTAADLTGSRPDGPVPIGEAVGSNLARVVADDGSPVAPGELGELVMGGPQVARGYLGRPETTAERFLPDPDGDGRWYRTGDLVSTNGDGQLVYHGRIDRQVKIRGYRVELEAIEAVLRSHPGVRDGLVIVRPGTQGIDRLLAYVIPADPTDRHLTAGLMELLDRELPPFMVPQAISTLEAFPLTASSKIDERALPEPEAVTRAEADTGATDAPAEVLTAVRRAWGEVLGMDDVPTGVGFFELGGHSLLAIRVLAVMRRELGVDLTLDDLFRNDTAERFAVAVAAAERVDTGVAADRAIVSGSMPLSAAQERLWFLDRLDPRSPAYLIPDVSRLRGALDVDRLRAAYDALAERHSILRTRYADVDGVPVQIVDPPGPAPFQFLDVSADPRPEAAADELVERWKRVPVDLFTGPVWRITLIRVAADDHLLVTVIHHIATDGMSTSIAAEEVAEVYRAAGDGREPDLVPLTVQYADCVAQERQALESGELDADREWWRAELAGIEPLDLPTDHPRPDLQTFNGATRRFEIPGIGRDDVAMLGSAHNATKVMVGLALFSALTYRLTGSERFVVGLPSSDRFHLGGEDLIGLFVNSLPVVVEPRGDMTFAELVASVRRAAVDAYAHGRVPFDQIVHDVMRGRHPGRNPIFDVMFQYGFAGSRTVLNLPGIEATPLPSDIEGGHLDLAIELDAREDHLVGSVTYNPDLFQDDTVSRFVRHLSSLAVAAAGDPDCRLDDLPLLDDGEHRRVVESFGRAGQQFPDAPDVMTAFTTALEAHPDRPALVRGDEALRYREMGSAVAAMARSLETRGAGPGSVVALHLEAGPELAIAILGTLACGAAFVTLDTTSPLTRRRHVLADSGAQVAVAGPVDGDWLPVPTVAPATSPPEPLDLRPAPTDPTALAYIAYVSGPDGAPRGVSVTRGNLAAYLASVGPVYGLRPDDRVLRTHSPAFDVSLGELFPTLAAGAALVHPQKDVAASAAEMLRSVEEERATVVHLTTSAWHELASGAVDSADHFPADLQLVTIGGEAARPDLVRRWLDSHRVRLLNLYGPTETTVAVTAADLAATDPGEQSVTIGKPMASAVVYILDRNDRPCPIGVAGELVVGGPQVTAGYAGLTAGTSPGFVPDPFSGGTMYRTGDRARWRADGNIEFLGRSDRQVKLQGVRTELAEIETVIASHPGVAGVVVDAVQHDSDLLVRAAIRADDVDVSALRVELSSRLPEFMIPDRFTVVEKFPLTTDGTIDLRALFDTPDPSPTRPQSTDPAVAAVVALFEEVLQREAGPESDFFELGGTSLHAVRLLSLIERRHGVSIPLSQVFGDPRPLELARSLPTAEAGAYGAATRPAQDIAAGTVFPIVAGTGVPVFCFHPGGGGVMVYRPMAEHLDGALPLLGVVARGADGITEPHRRIEDMVRHYADAIQHHVGSQPVNLLGYSVGGLVAFETARELERRGAAVRMLGLIDTYLPPAGQSNSIPASLLRTLRKEDIGRFARHVRDEIRSMLGVVRHGPRWMSHVVRRRAIPPEMVEKRLTHISDAAVRRYRYDGGTLQAPIAFFRASSSIAHRSDAGWHSVGNDLHVVDIPGDHDGANAIVNEPHVARLAEALLDAVRDSETWC